MLCCSFRDREWDPTRTRNRTLNSSRECWDEWIQSRLTEFSIRCIPSPNRTNDATKGTWPETLQIIQQVAAVIDQRPSYRMITPDPEIWWKAGVLSGTLAR